MRSRSHLGQRRRGGAIAGSIAALLLCLTAASPAAADSPLGSTDTVVFVDAPCGVVQEITISVAVSVHLHDRNEVVHVSRTGSTSAGYVMDHGVESLVFNGQVARGAFVDNWHSEDGSRSQVRGVFVVNLNTDEVVVDSFVFNCITT